jgi:Leucine-rich repeat (LRR) protein
MSLHRFSVLLTSFVATTESMFDASNNDLTGPIPDNFIANAAADASISIYLRNNDITGTVPLELKRFVSLDIQLGGNEILVIPQELCEISGWMNGMVGSLASCSAILCPKGTFNQFGRELPGNPCLACEPLAGDPYLGHDHCEDFTSERDTLNKLHKVAGGEFWKNASLWQSEAPICSWEGVACENGDLQDAEGITSLRLDANGLSGTLPSDVWSLPSLRLLSLNDNPRLKVNLEGVEAGPRSLEVLQLSQTNMESLEGISALTSLKELHVTGNGIAGTFPEELLELSNTIEALYIAENHFFGSLPTKIGEMTRLRSLFAYENDFLSTIPSEIGRLSYLKQLGMLYGTERKSAHLKFSTTLGLPLISTS